MALVAPVENGKIVETASQTSVSKAAKSSSGMDKEAFLQLLVAQMKYQDPLEPTSNTEYIAQYAQFSQVEQMQNMSNSMDLQRASSLVGKEVYIKTTTSLLLVCYDLRFPELALTLALKGADVLVVPAAWVKGPLKEHHWATLLTARALDTTCYVVASGECGNKNIGQSRVVDPLGVTIAAAAEAPVLLMTELQRERITLARQQLPVLRNRRFAPPQLL